MLELRSAGLSNTICGHCKQGELQGLSLGLDFKAGPLWSCSVSHTHSRAFGNLASVQLLFFLAPSRYSPQGSTVPPSSWLSLHGLFRAYTKWAQPFSSCQPRLPEPLPPLFLPGTMAIPPRWTSCPLSPPVRFLAVDGSLFRTRIKVDTPLHYCKTPWWCGSAPGLMCPVHPPAPLCSFPLHVLTWMVLLTNHCWLMERVGVRAGSPAKREEPSNGDCGI